jgi:hypothetical protein
VNGDIGVAKQCALLRGHLEQVVGVLAPLREIDEPLYARLQPLLDLEVTKLRDRVAIAETATDPWAEVRDLREDAAGLFTECLGFLGGAVALKAKLDDGRCRIANHIVAEVRTAGELPGHAISVPAEREYVHVLSSLIRLRFPSEGLWDLPVVVHELGHAVCDQLGAGTARLAVAAAAAEERDPPDRYLLGRYEELWADVFGAYVGGVSYAATCLRLRFDPSTAGASNLLSTHPSVDRRAEAILATLEHLEQRRRAADAIGGSFEPYLAELVDAWVSELDTAGRARPSELVAAPVRAAVTRYCAVLDAAVPTLRRQDLTRAEGAILPLETGAARPPKADMLDILDAAWFARLRANRNGGPVEHLATRASAWCEEVAGA